MSRGRPGWRLTTGGRLRLDVRNLAQGGGLGGGRRVVTWSRDGEQVAQIGYQATDAELRLDYKANGEPKAYAVPLDWTPCHYGGRRPWFRCPRCRRRAAVLFMVGGIFECRCCRGLAYPSQAEDRRTRLLRRRDRFRARLGAPPGMSELEKPPRMHWRTFERLSEAADAAEAESLASLAGWLSRLGCPVPEALACPSKRKGG